MDTILEEKRKGEKNFRLRIDDFLSKSPYLRDCDQLTPQTIQDLLCAPNFDGVCSNGRVNLEKLCEKVAVSEGQTSAKELMRVLGNKREMKISELHQLLRGFELHEFDLEEEIVRYFFEAGALSLGKLETVMVGLGMAPLNSKDRQILVECFDYDRNKQISRTDLQQLARLCQQPPPAKSNLRLTQSKLPADA